MGQETKLQELKALLAEISDLKAAAGLLGWDQQVNLPPGGAEARGNQLGTLERLVHDRSTSPEMGKLLDELKPYAETLDPASDGACMIRVTAREYDKAMHIPGEFVVERNQVQALAYQAWVEARQKSDYSIFRPHMEKVVELAHRYVAFFPPADHPYDLLLDNFEPGMKTAEVKAIFAAVRPKQVELIKAIAGKPQVDDAFLHQA
jgi:carboxypeptidase Taq